MKKAQKEQRQPLIDEIRALTPVSKLELCRRSASQIFLLSEEDMNRGVEVIIANDADPFNPREVQPLFEAEVAAHRLYCSPRMLTTALYVVGLAMAELEFDRTPGGVVNAWVALICTAVALYRFDAKPASELVFSDFQKLIGDVKLDIQTLGSNPDEGRMAAVTIGLLSKALEVRGLERSLL